MRHDMDEKDIHYVGLLVGLAMAAAFLFLVSCSPRQAHAFNNNGKWDNAPFKEWFARQYSENGYCCNWADAAYYRGAWKLNPDGSVTLDAANGGLENLPPKYQIPFSLADPNPTGNPVIWRSPGGTTYCFAFPGPQI